MTRNAELEKESGPRNGCMFSCQIWQPLVFNATTPCLQSESLASACTAHASWEMAVNLL